jgi:tetratricopeptide (TPR) repeat protein
MRLLIGFRCVDEWYRDPRWDKAATEEFERRLARARLDNRPQYLRIKALTLLESGGKEERVAARGLLRRIIEDYDDPLNDFDFLIARETLAELDAADGAFDEAEAQYRAALQLSSESNVRGDAPLALVELLIRRGGEAGFAEAETLLDGLDHVDLTFKSQRFRYAVYRARLSAARGNAEEAGGYAVEALREASTTAPDFPRHPDVGHVQASNSVLQEMRNLADASGRA